MAGGGTLVIQTAFLGDVVLTTGLLSALAARHGPVDVLVTPAALPLLTTHPAVRKVRSYDKHGRDRGLAGWWRQVRALREPGYARVYLPHRSLRSAALAKAAGIPVRIGFADGSGAFLYTERIARPAGGHEAERLLALAGSGAGPVAAIHLALTEDDRAEAYAWLASRGIGDGFVAVAPGSIWGTKRWPGVRGIGPAPPGADRGDRRAGRPGGCPSHAGRSPGPGSQRGGSRALAGVGRDSGAGRRSGHQRFGPPPPGKRDRDADGGDLRTDGSEVRLRPPSSPVGHYRTHRPGVPALFGPWSGQVPAWSSSLYARDSGVHGSGHHPATDRLSGCDT